MRVLFPLRLVPAPLRLVAAAFAVTVLAAATPPRPDDRAAMAPAPGFTAYDQLPALRSRVGANLPTEALDLTRPVTVRVQAWIDTLGVVRAARVFKGGTPFDSAAVDAVRWWLFDPARQNGRAVPSVVTIPFTVERVDADALVPDVLALARDFERAGDTRNALDAWTGVVGRVGAHPLLADPWTPRAHVLRLADRLPKRPDVPLRNEGQARGAYNLMLRSIARGDNEDYVRIYDEVTRVAPWFTVVYRWSASARAACGQRDDAMRALVLWSTASPDSASRALADRALRALATRDTLAATIMLR